MRGALRRVVYSRVMWFAAVIAWICVATEYWYEVIRDGFTELKTVQLVLVTGLAGVFVGSVIVNRAWRKRNDDAH